MKKYLPDFIFGSIDGLVTTFAVVSGVIGASLSPAVILILGFANLFADGFSMAASNYLSSKSEEDLGHNSAEKKPITAAFITFVSFVVIGFVPLFSFIVPTGIDTFLMSCILTGLAFIFVGYVKGKVTNTNRAWAACATLMIGTVAAVIAYFVGYFLSNLI
ncbi:MAG: VIT1/CCC1 transporter family protein [Patescibacteria group bacterium]